MKACLSLGRRFSILGHAIALMLKKKYGIEEFCGYTYMRFAEKFLKSQKDILYQPLLIDEDLHHLAKKEILDLSYIKLLEKEYGIPNLWPYIDSDRYFMMSHPKYDYSYIPICNHEEMLKHLQVRFREICKMFEEKKPDFILFSTVGALGTNILYQVAKKKGIKTANIEHTGVRDRITITDNCYNRFTEIDKTFDSIMSGKYKSVFRNEATKFLEEFRKKPSPRVWEETEPFSPLSWMFRVSRNFWYYITSYIKDAQWEDYLIESPISYFRNRIIKNFRRLQGFSDLFEQPRENEDFAFFPLHYEPEIGTLLQAPFYINQINLIQNIAKSLPIHFKLYVKEHPAMIYYRPRSYYQELKKIPSVRLIKFNIPSTSLVKKSKMIFTITGTSGWEGILLKKSVITFGSVFYNKLPMIKHCDNIELLPQMVKESLENYKYSEEELVNFISAIFENSISFDSYFHLWHEAPFEEILKNKDFKNFVDFLAKKLNLISLAGDHRRSSI